MNKNRIKIPPEIVQQVLVASRHTCCICREVQGGQIHHIDEDPANNELDNLAALCTNCHQKVHAKIPFQRGISPDHVKKYRNEWQEIVNDVNSGKRIMMGAAGDFGQGGQGGTVMITAEKMTGGNINVNGGDGQIGGSGGNVILNVKDLSLTEKIHAKGGKSKK